MQKLVKIKNTNFLNVIHSEISQNIAACTRPTLLALREDQRRRIRQDLCGRAARLAFFILLTRNIRLYCEGNLSHRLDRLHSLPFI